MQHANEIFSQIFQTRVGRAQGESVEIRGYEKFVGIFGVHVAFVTGSNGIELLHQFRSLLRMAHEIH